MNTRPLLALVAHREPPGAPGMLPGLGGPQGAPWCLWNAARTGWPTRSLPGASGTLPGLGGPQSLPGASKRHLPGLGGMCVPHIHDRFIPAGVNHSSRRHSTGQVQPKHSWKGARGTGHPTGLGRGAVLEHPAAAGTETGGNRVRTPKWAWGPSHPARAPGGVS